MKRILTALVLIPIVLLIVFLGPDWLLTIAAAAIAMLAAWEYLSIADGVGAKTPRIPVLVAIGLLFLLWFRWPDRLAAEIGALSLALLLYCAFAGQIQRALIDASTAVFALLYTGVTLLAVPALRASEDGKSLVLFLLCAVWAGDTVAMYVGRNLGRHKMAPQLSPGKTWEGAVGSIAGSLLVTAGLYELAKTLASHDITTLSYPGPLWTWLLLAVLVNVASQAGDLAESALKRSAGVKDSGTILPGHGGILDRIDALLVAAPVLWYAQVIQHF